MTRMSPFTQSSGLGLLVVSFLVGVILGLVVLGWWLWPVQWTNASPVDLQEAWQHTYLVMVADSYAQTGDAGVARERVNALVTHDRTAAHIASDLQAMAQVQSAANDPAGAARLQTLAGALGAQQTVDAPGQVTAPVSPPAQVPLLSRSLRVCGLIVLVLVILAGLLLLVYFLQSRSTGGMADEDDEYDAEDVAMAETMPAIIPPPTLAPQATRAPYAPPRPPEPEERTALGPFVATYNLGDIDFDMSFGIESASGDFLGECGLGMAETIGGGEVQRVTAFEVWLFDKTDIRTVSVVLASGHAYSDGALRTKLASRGELVEAGPGQEFSIKTSSLKLEGRILDLAYGGGDVPSQSYFTTFSVELVPVPLLAGQS